MPGTGEEFEISYGKYQLRFMTFLSLCPLRDDSCKIVNWLYYAMKIFCYIFLTIYIITSIMHMYKKENVDIAEISSNMLNTALYIGGIVRLSYYTMYGYKVKKLIHAMNKDFEPRINYGEGVNMDYYVKIANWGTLFWLLNVYSTTQLMSFVPLLFNFPKYSLPFEAWYPYDYKKSPNYQFTYLQQFLSNLVLSSIYPITDMFVVIICILTAGQFHVIGQNFKNCVYDSLAKYGVKDTKIKKFIEDFNNNDGGKDHIRVTYTNGQFISTEVDDEVYSIIKSDEFKKILNERMKKCVVQYQKVLNICELIEDFFNPILASILLFSVCYIIFMLYSAISVQTYSAMGSVLYYLISSFVQQFIITYFGQLLTSKCEDVANLIYESPWYVCDLTFQKSLYLTQVRLNRPAKMTAGKFFVLSLQMFLMMLRASFSYFTFLRQVSNH